MNITFACPACEAPQRSHVEPDAKSLPCAACGQAINIPAGAVQGNRVNRCLVCPSTDLYVRKDFPQRLGVALVVIGIVGSSIAWYFSNLLWTFGILFVTALVDVVLYMLVGNALMCYRCGAMYRGAEEIDAHGQFDLETHEKHRQIEARLRSAGQGGAG